ncbi:DEAD/DEAH box helicase [Terracoccus luteus]|uniref:ATP-dependent RNA helicase HelY n=1 Tax=Terracoccus luteus TaxID=53356 RepID=A0A839PWD5_9MICO|nr:DEAD/DEAH box helicase [Terracoccus luteus]MBB2987629.1 ATP-dependent RNA helicase HelY [Terracoccus luteus]MCP2173280.1 ATP-dependent RNA helicase HelY [Terracoccus luteus]
MIPTWPQLQAFSAALDFPLDDFQVEACRAVEEGRGVLVAAPTGAGKTVVGEFAVHLALATGRKAFYTTPIKALSNQKYADLVRVHGADRVGLLTGDSSVNGEAPIVVMTTEVLRNMMYAGSSTLRGLGWVVMDEVHYLADRFRGAVWEEVIIHLPADVSVVSLSATVSNAEEFGAWLGEVRGDTEVIVSEHRPVPLWQHMMVGQTLFDLFVEEVDGPTGPNNGRPDAGRQAAERRGPSVEVSVNPDLVHAIRGSEGRGAWDSHWSSSNGRGGRHRGRPAGRGRDDGRGRGKGGGHGGTGHDGRSGGPGGGDGGRAFARGSRPGGGASRVEVIERLEREGLLPAITFIFSRAGCDAAVGQLLSGGMRLIDEREGERNRRVVEERIQGLADEDLSVLGYWDFVDGIARGFAAHHAGMLPTFREIVEELFTAGRIKAVFATETLALGINMPARTVVLEKLVKFNGENHVDISPAEYTQLTGRAGRRGIDIEGHAVVLWNRGLDPAAVAGLASTRTYPLRSSFRPTYNMAVNLVRQFGRGTARDILETSFAQFQADRAVVGFVRTVRRNEEALAGYEESMRCHLGDFREYAALRDEIRTIEKEGARSRSASMRAAAAISLETLKIGDIVRIPAGRHSGLAVVVMPNRGGKGEAASPSVVTEDHQLRRLTLHDVPGPIEPLGSMRVPKQFNGRNPKARRDLAATLRATLPFDPPSRRQAVVDDGGDARIDELRRRMRAHPCHQCPHREEHARWAERWWRLRRETDGLQRKIDGRTNSVAKTFDRICDLLVDLGYLADAGETVTPDGDRLRRLYTEKDLLAAESLRAGLWKALDAPSLAAVVSTLVHEPRREEGLAPRWPNDDVRDAYDRMIDLWSRLEDAEGALALPRTGMPDGGLAWAVHRWASGQRLEDVLRGTDLAAGDFVRRCKQVIDLLGQLQDAGDVHLGATARAATTAVMRGVVAADRID